MEPLDANELYPDYDPYEEEPWDDSDYEDDDPFGCCCPGECCNPHYHHRMSECYTAEDMLEPSKLREFWWMVKFRAEAWFWWFVGLFRSHPEEDEDDIPF